MPEPPAASAPSPPVNIARTTKPTLMQAITDPIVTNASPAIADWFGNGDGVSFLLIPQILSGFSF